MIVNPVRSLILAAAGSDAVRRVVSTAPVTRRVARRFVAGETPAEALDRTGDLVEHGLRVTLGHLGGAAADRRTAERTVQTHLALLDQLHDSGLAGDAEVSLRLSAVGQALDERLALDSATRICAAAEQGGTTVTLDMEDHTTTDSTLRVLAELHRAWPSTGVALQARLRRTPADCRALAGHRVRLCKGAYAEPASVAFTDPHEVDLNYVRCANALLAGPGYPMFATHDPRLIGIVAERARWHDRAPEGFEFQLLLGARPAEQARLAAEGHVVRVYAPHGEQWYGYLTRRLAERPADAALFLRSLVSRS